MKTTYTGTISLNQPDPKYGDHINFHITTDAPRTYVSLTISQAGAAIAHGGDLFYSASEYDSQMIGLYAPSWPSGAADCVAELQSVKSNRTGRTTYTTIASVAFSVAA